ncbi:MAG: hypothetical protein IJP01_07175, partial [Oscillospiraceae bacterium]|nr:hypothetical protein [Oscillospiraceae bacterium]
FILYPRHLTKEIRGMKKVCVHCGKEFDEAAKKCPECGKRLKTVLTKEEQKEIEKQNDDMVAINTMLPM